MRRIVVISVAGLALLAWGVVTALAASSGKIRPISRAQAVAFAQAVNLRASDLPGATALHGAIFAPEAVQYEALKCGRQSKIGETPVGGGESWLNDSFEARVGSIVVVAPSQHIAEAELTTLATRRGRTCLTRALGRALEFERHHKPEWSHTVKATFIPIAKLVGSKAVAIHVLAELPPIEEGNNTISSTSSARPSANPPSKPTAIYINTEASFFRVGPAEVAFFALGETQFPPATEAHLLTLLHSRAEAHKL